MTSRQGTLWHEVDECDHDVDNNLDDDYEKNDDNHDDIVQVEGGRDGGRVQGVAAEGDGPGDPATSLEQPG